MIYFLFASSVHYLSALLGRHYGFACWAPVLYTMGLVSQRSSSINSMPITLESIPLKIFTSCLRDSMFAFLRANCFIEHKIQKGFLPQLTGTFEHTAQMANVINTARIKQKSLVITLLDLKHAFGEVHHNLIPSVLRYHQVPDHIQMLIRSF